MKSDGKSSSTGLVMDGLPESLRCYLGATEVQREQRVSFSNLSEERQRHLQVGLGKWLIGDVELLQRRTPLLHQQLKVLLH